MHAAVVTTGPGIVEAQIHHTAEPQGDQVRIRVTHSSLIPFDTYQADLGYAVGHEPSPKLPFAYPLVLGFTLSGIVDAVGTDVSDLGIGDRVTAFAFENNQAKSTQEFAVLSRGVVAKIPESVDLASAATIPDNFVTAYFTLTHHLNLQLDSGSGDAKDDPILIYGAGSSVGDYLIQLLAAANYTKILATASEVHQNRLLAQGAYRVIDYRRTDDVSSALRASVNGAPIRLAVDCVATSDSMAILKKALANYGARVAFLLPFKLHNDVVGMKAEDMQMDLPADENPFSPNVNIELVRTFTYRMHADLRDKLMADRLPQFISKGTIRPNRVRLISHKDGSSLLERVQLGLDLIRRGVVRGEKVVIEVSPVPT